MGMALMNIDTCELVRTGTCEIGPKKMCKANEAYVIARSVSAVELFLAGDKITAFICERNLKMNTQRALDVQGCGLLGYFYARDVRILMIQPMDLKNHFELECTGSHTQNKKAPLQKIRELGYPPPEDDHQTDAILLARYWINVVHNYSQR